MDVAPVHQLTRPFLTFTRIQMGLFDGRNRKRSEKLMKTLDAVNLKMGSGTLAYAATSLAGTGSWHTVFEKRSPFYTTDWMISNSISSLLSELRHHLISWCRKYHTTGL
jgi:hypothetical protein